MQFLDSYRHSGGIPVRVHDDIWTDAGVTERHVLLRHDEPTNTYGKRTKSGQIQTDKRKKLQKKFSSWTNLKKTLFLFMHILIFVPFELEQKGFYQTS